MFQEMSSTLQSVFSLNGVQFPAQVILVLLLIAVASIWAWKRRARGRPPPGPTGLPLVGYLPFIGPEPHKTFLELRKKYKSNIIGLWLGPKYTVILNEYEVMKEAFSHPAALDKPPSMFDIIEGVGFSDLNGEAWAVQRRFFMHIARDLGFGTGIGEEMMQEEVKSFVEDLASFEGKPVDVSSELMRSVSNSVFSLLVSRRFEKGKDDEKLQLLEDFSNVSLSYTAPTYLATLIPKARKLFEYLKIGGYDKAAKVVRSFSKLVREEIERHKNSPDRFEEKNFINMYASRLEEKVKEQNNSYFSDKDLEGNIKLIFLGASDTSFSSLMWLIYLLSKHPEIQKKIQNELDSALGEDGIASYYERHKIPYTFATLMESQRVSTIVRLISRRANADFEVNGYSVPRSSQIMGNVWALHNDPTFWPEPEKFRPERFLDSEGRLIKNPQSYAVFSFGRRNCPGETIAWMKILSYITSILRRFDIRPPPGPSKEWDVVPGLVLHLKAQPLCFLERRR